MANINKMKMAQTVISNEHITVKKGFLGLSTTVTYQPTGSKVNVTALNYSPEEGPKVKTIIGLKGSELAARVEKTEKIEQDGIGHYHLDLCYSDDHEFAAMQMLQFSDFNYGPVTEPVILEGADAKNILKLLV